MRIRFRCPHCDQLLGIGSHKAGSQIDCPTCDHSVTVPTRKDLEWKTTTATPAAPAPSSGTDASAVPDASRQAAGSPPSTPETAITAAPEASVPPSLPEPMVCAAENDPLKNLQGFEAAVKPAIPAPEKMVSAVRSFTRKHAWIVAGGMAAALLIVAGSVALLPRRDSKATPQQQQVAQAEDRYETPPSESPLLPKAPEEPQTPPADPPPKPAPTPPVAVPSQEKGEKESKPEEPPLAEKKQQRPVAPPAPPPVPPAAPVEPKKTPTPPVKFAMKNRRETTEDQLRRHIEKVPEISLDRGNDRTQAKRAVLLAQVVKQAKKRTETVALLVKNRHDLAGLPFIMGEECHLTLTAAEHLQSGSLALRKHLSTAASTGRGGDGHPDPNQLSALLKNDGQQYNKWLKPEAIPTLQQMLMAEDQATREVLIDQLARIDDKRASLALAQHALFDLHPRVRGRALEALSKRPHAECQAVFLAGFRHPWSAVADHAAAALVSLNMRQAVPALVGLLDQPHPTAPFKKPGQKDLYVREMVCVNHFRNCLLCHPASLDSKDKVRGAVPDPNRPLPTGIAYYSRSSMFVRADTTYLRQDFSTPRTVENPGEWPAAQRFDFLVRERPATRADVRAAHDREANGPSEHQKALLFALRELTGTDLGPSVEDWKRQFLIETKATRVRAGFSSASGVAEDERGRVWISVAGQILFSEDSKSFTPWFKELPGCKGLALDHNGHLLVCQTFKRRVVAIDLDKRTLEVLADYYQGKPLNGPRHLVVDRQGGIYFTDAGVTSRGNVLGVGGAVYYLSAQRTLTRLPIALPAPVGIALSPDEKTLYLSSVGVQNVMAYPLEGVGLPGEGGVLGKQEKRGDLRFHATGGLSVDGQGNVFLAHTAMRAIEVFNPKGARLGLISLRDEPLACVVGGSEGKTLHVVSRQALYKVPLEQGLGRADAERKAK